MPSKSGQRSRANSALQDAGLAAAAGSWRKCADKYLEAYLIADAGWTAKYNCWSGYTSVIREDHFVASEMDLKALKSVAKDESAPRLDRQRAHFTRGYVRYALGDREGAARSYRSAIDLCNAATAAERSRKVTLPDRRTNQYMPTPSGPIFDDTLKTATENLKAMEEHKPMVSGRQMDTWAVAERMTARFQENLAIGLEPMQACDEAFNAHMPKFITPIGPNVADKKATQQELAQLTRVSGSECDHCGLARRVDGSMLLKCSRCGLATYCSKECQKARWKAGHKAACRAPGEIKVGDRVRLSNVENVEQYVGFTNGMIVEVRAAAPDKGRWEVGVIGCDVHVGDTVCLATTELSRLRPAA